MKINSLEQNVYLEKLSTDLIRNISKRDEDESNLNSQTTPIIYHTFTFGFLIFGCVMAVIMIIYATIACKLISEKKNYLRKNLRRFTSSIGVSERSSHLKRFSSIDHKFVMDTLKKKPSKSILVTGERPKSIQFDANRQSMTNSNYRTSQVSNTSQRASMASNFADRPGVFNQTMNISDDGLDADNRKSAVSIKSVTFNEKTQIRRIKKVRKN